MRLDTNFNVGEVHQLSLSVDCLPVLKYLKVDSCFLTNVAKVAPDLLQLEVWRMDVSEMANGVLRSLTHLRATEVRAWRGGRACLACTGAGSIV